MNTNMNNEYARCLAALKAYWYFLQAMMFGAISTLAKFTGIEYVVRNVIPAMRGRIFAELYETHRGIAYDGDPPKTLTEYLTVAARAHESIQEVLSSAGLRISRIRVVEEPEGMTVEVVDAVPGMHLLPDDETRRIALAVSVGVLLGIAESVVGKRIGLRIPQIGVDVVSPGDDLVMEVVEFDVAGNRFVARIYPAR